MKRYIVGTGLFFALFLQSGCSHITMLRTEELRQVRAHVDSLRNDVVKNQERIVKVQEKQSELLRLIRADQQVRFSELDHSLSTLSRSIYESQHRLSKIDEKTQEITKRWEEKARVDSLSEASRETEINNLFDIAHKDFSAGRYDIAVAGFRDLMERYSDSPRAEDAAYWIAECHYARKKYDTAESMLMEYLKKYPEGEHTCVALFKLGLVYDKQKKSRAQELVWRKVVDQCPDSEEAAAIKARMGWR
ncbi:MAG: tetratricopeptide repeat protein [Chitinivibrionales bacterium]|nr:tetratricopeptide repeat protein [Chitinivibrionales bacterium]MBD3358963.1 tetratricopeptide repeat protein [Chitinivibrionales bacterium]